MDSKNIIAIGAIAVALICAGGWFHEHQTPRTLQRTYVSETLDHIVEMLTENAAITQELRTGPREQLSDDHTLDNLYVRESLR